MIENSFLISGKQESLWLFTEFKLISFLLNPHFAEYNLEEGNGAAVPPESLLYHENEITTVQLPFSKQCCTHLCDSPSDQKTSQH